ncbi:MULTISPECIES: hypothetical protein [unclassified Nocardioides]|uniref:hypothetical protein n=1 Tax=unclassified Nocardioides TaxID=2615069 RepID=UPI0006F418BD|nr:MULTISPECIES: hypothetical protein [unclassified Nocardioides]KRA38283.1 hypothetical protein ASD81_06465 [Nocardioides sp. Root614]KRA92242.1 hypothetical protein ASD84_06730 [Nocardioides sp. Root682]
MQIADGGGGGSSVGSYSSLIAAAATKAELMHGNWESTGDYTVKREINASNQYVVSFATVEFNTYSGEYSSDAAGALSDISKDTLVYEAKAAFDKWPPKIEGLFTKWQNLPSRYTSAALLDWAARELSIDPDNPQATGDSVDSVNTRLAGDLERIKTRTGQLNGKYAKAFADYYANQLPTTVQAQDMLVSALAVASRAQGEVWGRAADDLSKFEHDAWDAMKSSGPDGGPDTDLVLALTVVGALGSALASVPTLGGSVVLFGAISAAAAIGAGVESAKQADTSFKDLPLGADHPDKVFTKLEDALTALDDQIQVQEIGIRDFLKSAKSFADSGDCELSTPGLNSAPNGEVLSTHQGVTVNKDTIAQITELWLPSVAADLRQAEGYLTVTADDGFRRDTDIGLAPTGAWAEFSALQTRTSTLLMTLSKDLEDAGTKLEDAARDIGRTDEGISEHYRNIEKKVEDQNINDPDRVTPLL